MNPTVAKAYTYFEQQFAHRVYDMEIRAYLDPRIQIPYQDSLRRARSALYISAESVARRMGCTSAAYYALERSEAAGNLSLNRLRKAASALDCDLIYAFRPKSRQVYSQVVWNEHVGPFLHHPHFLKAHDMQDYRAKTLARLVREHLRKF